ncbi:hypothetical protein CBS101457_002735 [Exobasidium rhododendri]|nr:hypothetical protein CBS101457_002735 [Exobasidium rhododendri]
MQDDPLVIYTSGSEEGEEDAAFEDTLANTHTAQSAGLSARKPKRRHRMNGESGKGSKRSNSSAVVASETQVKQSRAAFRRRRSAASSMAERVANNKARSSMAENTRMTEAVYESPRKYSRTQNLLDTVLRKLFSVDDDEVLQAFLRDEGPLKVQSVSQRSLAVDASTATLGVGAQDEVWRRNERSRNRRLSIETREEEEEVEESIDVQDVSPSTLVRLPPRGIDSSQMLGAPPVRIRLNSHVGEPSLLEAFQATLHSNLAIVPSGFSILLAGSRSVRLVQHLASRIGPLLTDRVRKMIDDAEDDSSIPDAIIGSESVMTRFRGDSHPALSSNSSTTRHRSTMS